MNTKTTEISSHFAFGEHWNERPVYAGYVPEDKQWQSIKDEFCKLFTHNNENPKFLILKKGKGRLPVYVYGFRVPDAPPVSALGTDTATKGRLVFCKKVSTKECIAIAW